MFGKATDTTQLSCLQYLDAIEIEDRKWSLFAFSLKCLLSEMSHRVSNASTWKLSSDNDVGWFKISKFARSLGRRDGLMEGPFA